MSKQTTIQRQTSKGQAARSITIGIDIGDRWSHYCILDEEGEVVEEGRLRTTPTSVGKHFQGVPAARIAIEAGTHSIWIKEQLASYGHEVVVANVTELHAIVRNIRKAIRSMRRSWRATPGLIPGSCDLLLIAVWKRSRS